MVVSETMTESTYRIQGATGEWEVVIGLEVHAQIVTKAKLFSGAAGSAPIPGITTVCICRS